MYRTSMVRLLLNAQGGDGNGGGNGGPPPDPKPDASLQRRIKEAGNAGALAGTLYAENQHLQSQNAALRAKLPKDGDVVLSGDDVAAWNEFRALNLKPAEIKAAVGERDTLKVTVARHDRDKALADHGYKPETLGPLLPADASIEEVDGPKDGKGNATKTLAIRLARADKPKPLAEFVDETLPAFKPVIGGPDAKADEERPTFRRHGPPPAPAPRREAPRPGQGADLDPEQSARRELAATGSYSW